MPTRSTIRTLLLKQRRALSESQQSIAAENLLNNLKALSELTSQLKTLPTPTIGLYLSMPGEISLAPTIAWLRSLNVTTAIPVLHHDGKQQLMLFAVATDSTHLIGGQFGILEPDLNECQIIPATNLGAVLVPLLGFDSAGNRLGMGGGYYDRTFAHRQTQPIAGQLFTGVAHELQKRDNIPTESWDVPLDSIVTDENIYRTSQGPSTD